MVGSSPTSASRIRAQLKFQLFVEMPINSGLFKLECLVFDKVSWSDTPVFHITAWWLVRVRPGPPRSRPATGQFQPA
jgi:hypothetical protein